MATKIRDLSGTGAPWLVNATTAAGRDMVRRGAVELPPGHDPLAPDWRGMLLDYIDSMGNADVPSGLPSERLEFQVDGEIGVYGVEQWHRWAWLIEQIPAGGDNLWQFLVQWHGHGRFTVAMAAAAAYRGQLWLLVSEGGRAWTVRQSLGPILLGERTEFRCRVVWSTDPAKGRFQVFRDGVERCDVRARTTGESRVPYIKRGVYRDQRIDGRVRYTCTGQAVYDADPGPFTTDGPPPDTAAPQVEILMPAQGSAHTGRVLVEARVTDAGQVDMVQAGLNLPDTRVLLTATDTPGVYRGEVTIPATVQAPETRWLWVNARDKAGNQAPSRSMPVTVSPPAPAPTPVDEMRRAVAHELDQVRAAANRATTLLTGTPT